MSKVKENNSLATRHPEIAAQWHPTKNGGLTPEMVTRSSNKKVWWICEKGHEWEALISGRHQGNGCPHCAHQARTVPKTIEDSLFAKYPKLAAEWHPTKNGALTPERATRGSSKKIWWICANGHEWEASIRSRALYGHGCPYCSGRNPVVGENDLATVYPEIAAQWHPTKNGELTPEMVTKSSGKKIWWVCERGHEWQTTINCRTSGGSGCPRCHLLRRYPKKNKKQKTE